MPDVPHLFKNIKQSIFNNKCILLSSDIVREYSLPSSLFHSKHIEALAEHQNDLELKLVRKVDIDDFKKINHFDKMKISMSTSMLSTEVSASLEDLVDNEGFDKSFETTALFVKQVIFTYIFKLILFKVLAHL